MIIGHYSDHKVFVTLGIVLILALTESMTPPVTSRTGPVDTTATSTANRTSTTVSPKTPDNTSNVTASVPTTSTTASVSDNNSTTAAPTKIPTTEWQINSTDGHPCMLLQFRGYILFKKSYDTWWTVEIPDTAWTNGSTCFGDKAYLKLQFLAPTEVYNMFGLELTFYSYDEKPAIYRLRKVKTFLNSEETHALYENSQTGNFVVVPMGYYYTCQNLTLIPGDRFNVTLFEPKLQPFVNATTHGNYGDAYVCQPPTTPTVPTTPPAPGHLTNKEIGTIIGGVLAAIVVIVVMSVVAAVVITRRSPFRRHRMIDEEY